MQERLQKIISRAGIASRRHAEQLILSGAVTVNGQVVTELGSKADPERDHIRVGPRMVKLAETPERYLAFHKPAQVVSTMSDPEQRPCLGPFLRGFAGRLFPVGRLDFDAAGLLLLTSDGILASDLMRGAAVVPQTWRFKVKGRIAPDDLRGIERVAGARVRLHRDAPNAWYEAELAGGGGPRGRLELALQRNSVLVEKMVRSKFGGVDLDGLEPGGMRALTSDEVQSLRRAVAGRRGPATHHAPESEAPARPGGAGLERAVEEWRTAHPRKRHAASGRTQNRAQGKARRDASGRGARPPDGPRQGREHRNRRKRRA